MARPTHPLRRLASALPPVALVALSLPGCAAGQGRVASLPPRAGYVAMGSSFAAGPGVTRSADTPATRCTRSADNYAHQLARRRNLALVDVSCGGATSAHLIGPWRELPAQVDALSADTLLATVTIGGNDVGYVGGLMAASCPDATRTAATCRPFPRADDAAWTGLEARLDAFARTVALRAPRARLIFVDYPTILPRGDSCAATPLSAADAAAARAVADRLVRLTEAVAERHGAGLVDVAALSRGHDACATVPWVNGYAPPGGTTVPYHPVLAGMTAIAAAIDRALDTTAPHTNKGKTS